MSDKEIQKLEEHKENIRKYIARLYATTSVTAEANTTDELIKEVKKVSIEDLIDLSKEFDIFGKCVFHYRLPIDLRLDIGFSKATEVPENERKVYWREYKSKLKELRLNGEEEYNKIILMACTLHVPINDEDEEKENDGENPVNIVEIDKANNINQ
ncbi:MAG: hypothetical protein IJ593_11610 [Lachnospiraceae bacterium]|nr:hypothetical protein [Lachnospiraceae bacterium]